MFQLLFYHLCSEYFANNWQYPLYSDLTSKTINFLEDSMSSWKEKCSPAALQSFLTQLPSLQPLTTSSECFLTAVPLPAEVTYWFCLPGIDSLSLCSCSFSWLSGQVVSMSLTALPFWNQAHHSKLAHEIPTLHCPQWLIQRQTCKPPGLTNHS